VIEANSHFLGESIKWTYLILLQLPCNYPCKSFELINFYFVEIYLCQIS